MYQHRPEHAEGLVCYPDLTIAFRSKFGSDVLLYTKKILQLPGIQIALERLGESSVVPHPAPDAVWSISISALSGGLLGSKKSLGHMVSGAYRYIQGLRRLLSEQPKVGVATV